MNVLLTGATGFLGKQIKPFFTQFNLFELSRSEGDICCDLANEIPHFIDPYDLVIHAAGKAHIIPNSDKDANVFYSVNVIGTRNLLEGFEKSKFKPKYFVFISSVAVYGRTEGMYIPEDSELLARDSYGLSKILAELLIQEWCKQNNVILTIVRPPLIIGEDAKGNLKDLISSIAKGYYFNIAGGKARKSMVLATDIAQFILVAFRDGGIYVLTDGFHPSFYELSKIIAKKLNKQNPKNIPLVIAKKIAFFSDFLGIRSPLNSSKLNKITSTLTFSDYKARNKFGWESNSVLTFYSNSNL